MCFWCTQFPSAALDSAQGRGALAYDLHSTGRQGVNVNNGSTATILNNTIQNNPQGGIIVNGGSSVDIGFTGTPDDRVPSPNIIQNNSRGISISRSSVAQIGYNTITNNADRGIDVTRNSHAQIGGLSNTGPSGNTVQGNGSDGVRVNRASHGDISGNAINSNGGDGIRVEENSGVNLDEANTTTVNNGGRGLRCRFGAYARGSLGTLNGNTGQTSFEATCINALSP